MPAAGVGDRGEVGGRNGAFGAVGEDEAREEEAGAEEVDGEGVEDAGIEVLVVREEEDCLPVQDEEEEGDDE